MTALAKELGLLNAVGFSISIIEPIAAMALNVPLTVQAAGRAAPLAFAIATAVMTIVLSVYFSWRNRASKSPRNWTGDD